MVKSITEILRSHAVIIDGKHTNGTDKQSNHNYGPTYEKLFPDREAIKTLLEIGITDGSCLLAWKEIFPNAEVVGLDIYYCSNRSLETYVGNQGSQKDCEQVVKRRLFDVIIEDAIHNIEHTLLTFFWLWPYVAPGGLYIVEEWADIGNCKKNILALGGEIIDTEGPFGGNEPLVVFRK